MEGNNNNKKTAPGEKRDKGKGRKKKRNDVPLPTFDGPSVPKASPHDAPYVPVRHYNPKYRSYTSSIPKFPNLSAYKDKESGSPEESVPSPSEQSLPGAKSVREQKPVPVSAPAKMHSSTPASYQRASKPSGQKQGPIQKYFRKPTPPPSVAAKAHATNNNITAPCTPAEIERKQMAAVKRLLTRQQGGIPPTTMQVRMYIKHQARLNAPIDENCEKVKKARARLTSRSTDGYVPTRRDINAYLISKEDEDPTPDNKLLSSHKKTTIPAEEDEIPPSVDRAVNYTYASKQQKKSTTTIEATGTDGIVDSSSDGSTIEVTEVRQNAPRVARKRKSAIESGKLAIRKVRTTTNTTTRTSSKETVINVASSPEVPSEVTVKASELTADDIFPGIESYVAQASSMTQRNNRVGALLTLGRHLLIGDDEDPNRHYSRADAEDVNAKYEELCARMRQENYEIWVLKRTAVVHQAFIVAAPLHIDFKKRAIEIFEVDPYNYSLIDWWAYDGRCIPAVGERFKTEHTAEGKQADILEKILFHPVRNMVRSNAFCHHFEQGDTAEFELRFRFHCSKHGQGTRSWPMFSSEDEKMEYMMKWAKEAEDKGQELPSPKRK